MSQITGYLPLIFFGFIILVHVIRIIYLMVKPGLLPKIRYFENRQLSAIQLGIYYVITILMLSLLIWLRYFSDWAMLS
ncbi:MAG TPA: hypothetical protein PKW54_05980 [Ferruginibacter sp.]|nr:hypothetical protein [Ferruginibacter sp.]